MKKAVFVLLSFFLLVSCSSSTITKKDAMKGIDMPDAFSLSGSEAANDKWWLDFNDDALNGVVERALAGNFSLKMAKARLDQAYAAAKVSGADVYPALNANAGAGTSFTNQKSMANSSGDVKRTDSFSAGLSLSYEVDLWGRVSSLKDAALYDVNASRGDLESAAVTLTAETAKGWYQLVAQNRLLDFLKKQEEIGVLQFDIMQNRYKAGMVSYSDVLSQENILSQLRGQIEQAELAKTLDVNRLSYLIGVVPSAFDLNISSDLPVLPPFPDTGIPSDVVNKRGDVKAAFERVRAADSRVASAIADRYPKISLSASASLQSDSVSDFFTNWVSNLAANITMPLFDGGRLSATVEAKKAVLDEAVQNYGDTVLTAVREIEDAIAQERSQQSYVEKVRAQYKMVSDKRNLAYINYKSGVSDYAVYLTAENAGIVALNELFQAESTLLLYRIELYRAISGNFEVNENK